MVNEEQQAIRTWLSNRIAKLCSLTIFLMIVLVGVIYYAGYDVESTVKQYNRYIVLHDAALDLSALTERLHSKQETFFLNKIQKDADSYDRTSDQTMRAISELNRLDTSDRFINLLKKISELVQSQNQIFSLALLSQLHLGLTLEEGLHNDMRSAAHELEALMKKCVKDAKLEVALLQMRRHEKDFLLKKEFREDLPMSSYVHDYTKRLNEIHLKPATKQKLVMLLNQYIQEFNEVSKEYQSLNIQRTELKNLYLENQIVVYNLLDYSRSYTLDLQDRLLKELYQWKMIIGTMSFIFLLIIGLYGLSTLRILSKLK